MIRSLFETGFSPDCLSITRKTLWKLQNKGKFKVNLSFSTPVQLYLHYILSSVGDRGERRSSPAGERKPVRHE
jgi:hypothetical protein